MENKKFAAKEFEKCRQIMEANSKTFSLAFNQLPSPKKEAVWAFYALNRRLDDLGDEKRDLKKLNDEKKAFLELQDGRIKEDFLYKALAIVQEEFFIDTEAVLAMFRGQFKDANCEKIRTDEDLLDYCFEVAGSVGYMLLPILASHNYLTHLEILKESAWNIGIGMQLTNILRDVYEDHENDRIYFPKEILESYEIEFDKILKESNRSSKDLIAKSYPNYIKMWEHYAKKADQYYAEGLKYLELYDVDSQWILEGAVLLYREILNVTRSEGYGLIKNVKVSDRKKMEIMNKVDQKRRCLV